MMASLTPLGGPDRIAFRKNSMIGRASLAPLNRGEMRSLSSSLCVNIRLWVGAVILA